MITLKELVKGTTANFTHEVEGVWFYTVEVGEDKYQFPVDMNNKEDIGYTIFDEQYKAITLMRYIRKAIANETLIKLD